MLALVGASLALLLQHWMLGLLACVFTVYLWIRLQRFPVIIIGCWLMVLAVVYRPASFDQGQHHWRVVVVSTHERYILIQHRWHRYYLEQAQQVYDIGDVLIVTGTILPLRLTHYESLPSLHESLLNRGVSTMFRADHISIYFKNPLRIFQLKKTIVSRFPQTIQAGLSRIMFDERLGGEDTYDYDVIAWLSLSGFGFYLAVQAIEKSWMIVVKKQPARVLTLLMIGAYGLLMVHSLAIMRIVLMYAMQTLDYRQKFTRHDYRLGWLCVNLCVFPLVVLHRSMHWYWMYQLWFFLIVPLITHTRWKQYTATLAFGMIVQIMLTDAIQPLSVLLFLPMSLIQAGLWIVISLWTALSLPWLGGMEQAIQVLLRTVSLLTPLHHDWIIGTMAPWMVIIMLVGLLLKLGAWFYRNFIALRYFSLFVSIGLIIHLLAIDITLTESSLHFINVGQGDATLIRHRHHAVLIDTGGHYRIDIANAVLIPYFRKIRLRKLDAVIITHDDFDHHGALSTLQQNFPIRQVIADPFSEAAWGRIRIHQLTHDLPINPDNNETSLVLRFQFDQCSVMVMGDASIRNEALLIDRYPNLTTTLLRIGHHGSNTSTSSAFLEHTQPHTAIISLAAGNRYGHPHWEVQSRLLAYRVVMRRTDIEGTIVYRRCII